MTTNNDQLRKLIRQGFSKAEACQMLNIDMDAATMATMASSKEVVRLDSLRQDFLPRAFEILQEIAEQGERDSDRINAIKLIVVGEGIMPDLGMSGFDDRIKKMKAAMGEIIIDADFQQGDNNHCRQMVLAG